MKSKLRIAYIAYVIALALAFTGLLVDGRSATVLAQEIQTPTSPPVTYTAPLICATEESGGLKTVCSTATPYGWLTPTASPTFAVLPTSPDNTPMPYPGPYPGPQQVRGNGWVQVFLSWFGR
jgi:hypothetical protein